MRAWTILWFSVFGWAAAASAQVGMEPAVYRVAGDRDAIGALGDAYDVWSYLVREGVAIVPLDPGQAAALRERGYGLALDEERDAEWRAWQGLFAEGAERIPYATIPGFTCYRTVETTLADLASFAASHPQLASWHDFGDSWEKVQGNGGYDLYSLVLTNGAIPGPKPKFVLIAAIHARELATAEIATRFAERLVGGYGVDADLTWMLDHVEVHVVAQMNPDGRKRAEAGASWRKNTDSGFCGTSSGWGIDLNRNSSYAFGGTGSSGSACSETYRGPFAASEPETAAIEAYLEATFPDQRGDLPTDAAPADAQGVFISLHSFGQQVLYPWESTFNNPPNHDQLRTLGRKFGYFNQYTVCQDCLASASGTTVDVAYGEYGVAAYTFEVGTSFFQSCSTFESTVLPRNMEALLYAVKATRRPYQDPRGPDALDLAAPATVKQGQPLVFTVRLDDQRYASGGQGTESTQNVGLAYFSVDTPPWVPGASLALSPQDGAWDEPSEVAVGVVPTDGLAPGRHTLFVRGVDSNLDAGVPSAVFFQVLPNAGLVFGDGFESGDTSAWDG